MRDEFDNPWSGDPGFNLLWEPSLNQIFTKKQEKIQQPKVLFGGTQSFWDYKKKIFRVVWIVVFELLQVSELLVVMKKKTLFRK